MRQARNLIPTFRMILEWEIKNGLYTVPSTYVVAAGNSGKPFLMKPNKKSPAL